MKKLLTFTVCILILSLLCTGCGALSSNRSPEPQESESRIITGQVEKDVVNGWNANVFALDDAIVGCEAMTIDFSAEMLHGARCKNWTIYVRTRNGWQAVGSLELPDGTGSTTKNLNLGESGYSDASSYIDAIVVQPDISGSYSWNWEISIYNVKQSKNMPMPNKEAIQATEAPSALGAVSGHWENDVVNGWSTNVFALDSTIKGCTSMTIYFNAEMQYGARCKDWTVYARTSGGWEDIGSLFLSNGTGETTTTLKLDGTKNIDAICIEPTVQGSYSWNMSIGVYDVQARNN